MGALFSDPAGRRFPLGRILTSGLVGFVSAATLLALARSPLPFVAANLIRAAALVVVNVQSISIRQGVTPDRLLGRVTGAFRTLVGGIAPAGNVLGGLAAVFLVVSLATALGMGLSRVESPTAADRIL